MASLYLFDFTLVRGFSTVTANLLLLAYIAAGFVGAPAVSALAARINKHRALMACTTLFALCFGTLFFFVNELPATVPVAAAMLAVGLSPRGRGARAAAASAAPLRRYRGSRSARRFR